MIVFGSLIALGAALLFLLVAALICWAIGRALRREMTVGFRSRPLPPASRGLVTLAVALPAVAAALLALLGAARILLVALGAG